jgi:hypothetical protein
MYEFSKLFSYRKKMNHSRLDTLGRENKLEYYKYISDHAPRLVEAHQKGEIHFFTASSSFSFYNQVISFPETPSGQGIEDVKAVFHEKQLPIFWNITTSDSSTLSHNEWESQLCSHGFVEVDSKIPSRGLFIDLNKELMEVSVNNQHQFYEIRSDDSSRDWLPLFTHNMAEAYNFPKSAERILRDIFLKLPCGPDHPLRHFIITSKNHNDIVSTVTVFQSSNRKVLSLYNLTTIHMETKKKFGQTICLLALKEVMRTKKAQNIMETDSYCILNSTPLSTSLFRKIGFQTFSTNHLYFYGKSGTFMSKLYHRMAERNISPQRIINYAGAGIVVCIIAILYVIYEVFIAKETLGSFARRHRNAFK